MNTVGIIR